MKQDKNFKLLPVFQPIKNDDASKRAKKKRQNSLQKYVK